MEYKSDTDPRYARLKPVSSNKLQAEWVLTDTKLIDTVILVTPPARALPIIFVPGIMGSNLCDLRENPVWLLNSVKGVPIGLAASWAKKNAGTRQMVLHPKRTKVFKLGNVPKIRSAYGLFGKDYIEHGWGEVSEASYHDFLLWLDNKMNGDPNPANWTDFLMTYTAMQRTRRKKCSGNCQSGCA